MANKRNKKRVILIACILIIIVIIIVLCVLRFIIFSKDDETENLVEIAANEKIDFTQKEKNIEKYVDGKTIPQGISYFASEYKGSIDRNTFYEKLYSVSNYLPDLVTELKESEDYAEYYKKNYSEIKKYLGTTDSSEFVEIANYLVKNDISGDELDYCMYEENTMNNYDKYSIFKMKFIYQNYGEIEFSIKLSNNSQSSVSVLEILIPNS